MLCILAECSTSFDIADHLIIQRIDAKDESEDVESILQYGAKAIFDDKEAEANAIRYTDSEVDTLLARSAEPIPEGEKTAAGAFAHAKIWERSGKLEDVTVNEEEESKGGENMHGFWANILDQQAEAERQAKIFASINVGRGKRNRGSTIAYKTDSPARLGKRRKGADSDGSSGDEFMDMDRTAMSDEDSDEEFLLDPDEAPKGKRGRSAFDEPKRRRGGLINPFGGNTDALKKVRDQYRRELIEHLAIFARRYGDPDVDLMLEQAAKATSRLDQSESLAPVVCKAKILTYNLHQLYSSTTRPSLSEGITVPRWKTRLLTDRKTMNRAVTRRRRLMEPRLKLTPQLLSLVRRPPRSLRLRSPRRRLWPNSTWTRRPRWRPLTRNRRRKKLFRCRLRLFLRRTSSHLHRLHLPLRVLRRSSCSLNSASARVRRARTRKRRSDDRWRALWTLHSVLSGNFLSYTVVWVRFFITSFSFLPFSRVFLIRQFDYPDSNHLILRTCGTLFARSHGWRESKSLRA